LEKGEYSDKDLENDIFNLMKFIFRTGQKWGSEKIAKTFPEAVIGYTTYQKNKNNTHKVITTSFIWDCKYHSGKEHYNLDRAEIDKARRYISQANGSNAIKHFSNKLNGYILFCNKIDQTNFENFRNKLYQSKKWKGSVILFEISALIKLCDYIKANYESFNTKFYVFLNVFSFLIEKPSDNSHVCINNETIDKLLHEVTSTNTPRELNITDLEKTFELDEY
jgi:hypothetical protein